MIFCAGFGTRMGDLVSNRPKPLIEVAGRSLIDRTLDLVEDAEIRNVVVNTHYLGDQIEAHLSDRPVRISHEFPDILDTGGGLKAALPLLESGAVFTANSDNIFVGPNPFLSLSETWKPEVMGALLLLVPLDRAIGRRSSGDFSMDASGRLSRGGNLVYSGIQIIHTDPVAAVPDRRFSLNRVWDSLRSDRQLFGTVWNGDWIDVGHAEGLKIANRIVEGVKSD